MQRFLLFTTVFCITSHILSAQNLTEEFRFGNMKIFQDEETGFYQIKKKKKIIANNLLQVKKLDKNNLELIKSDLNIQCLDKRGKEVVYNYAPNPKRRRSVFCGNSLMMYQDHPHIWIEPSADSIFVYRKQYHLPKHKLLYSCSKTETDRLVFVNGKTEYFVDTEVDRPDDLVYDLQLIFVKNGKKGLVGTDELADKDQIWYKEGFVMFRQNGLLGYSGINKEGRYRKLDKFDKGYAKFVLKDGTKGLVDLKGNEFLARK